MAVKVLIADDEKIIRDFFARLLGLQGCEVIAVDSGYKAVEETKKTTFDIIFLDVRMPGLDGLATFHEIRKINKDVPVVMITGFAAKETLEQAEKEGAWGSIKKPFEISQITEVIDKAVQAKEGGVLNILVVDDEKVILDFFERALKNKNYKLRVAKNGEEAIAAINSEPFDIVFLDIVLPGIDGFNIYRTIRGASPDTEVVMMTGYPDEKIKDIEEALRTGAKGCLYKPFEIEEIIRRIKETEDKKKANWSER